jgi:uncharacterized membrane protein
MTTLQQMFNRATPDSFEQQDQHPQGFVNVGPTERTVSSIAGAAMAVAGLARRGVGGWVLAGLGGSLLVRGLTGHCNLYAALGIDTNDAPAATPEQYNKRGIQVVQVLTVDKTPTECYEFWRNFENLPRFMSHLQSVKVMDNNRSHWIAKGPAGSTVEWDAEIINEEPYALIAWRSLDGADVDNAGSVRFVPGPGGRGTQVKVVMDYIPPAGRIGAAIATLFGKNADHQIREDLRSFKRIMETGEVPTTAGQPRGACAWFGDSKGTREEY